MKCICWKSSGDQWVCRFKTPVTEKKRTHFIMNTKVSMPSMEDSDPSETVFNPRHPEFMSCSSRLHTFRTWPKYHPTPSVKLAKAGFIYSGCGDRVFCFNCNTYLKDWKPTDYPKREHKRWAPRCSFIDMCHEGKNTDVKSYTLSGLDTVEE